MPSIKLVNVQVVYGSEKVLEIEHLEFTGNGVIQILGPNGAGKTTLLKLIAGLLKPAKGRVLINDVDVTGKPELAGRFVGYVPQPEHIVREEFPVTPLDVVTSALLLRRGWPRVRAKRHVLEHAKNMLKLVGLDESVWHKSVWELSGGQFQRMLIARALVYDPEILLMDEPLSAVDPQGRVELARLIGELGKRHMVLVASHDPVLLLDYTKMIVLLNRRVVAMGTPDEVLRMDVLSKVYGEAALEVEKHIHISDSHARIPTRRALRR